jgi:hypothetical protein
VAITKPGGDHTDPLQQRYRVYLFRRMPGGGEVITSEGPRSYADGDQPTASLDVPVEWWGPLVDAVLAADDRPMPTDAATLSSALDIERRRVDDVLRHYLRDG